MIPKRFRVKKPRLEKACLWCNAAYEVMLGGSNEGRKYCSAPCVRKAAGEANRVLHSGENSVRWNGGVHVRTYRRIAFEAHGTACTKCKSDKNVEVHHVNQDRTNNTVENLEVLCRMCHFNEHRETRIAAIKLAQTKTHCKRGHCLDDPANVYALKNGQRVCRLCSRWRYAQRRL